MILGERSPVFKTSMELNNQEVKRIDS